MPGAPAPRSVVLTHFSDELDPDWTRSEASRAYGGPVELAEEGAIYTSRRPAARAGGGER